MIDTMFFPWLSRYEQGTTRILLQTHRSGLHPNPRNHQLCSLGLSCNLSESLPHL